MVSGSAPSGRIASSGETSMSLGPACSGSYDGVMFEIRMQHGTYDSIIERGLYAVSQNPGPGLNGLLTGLPPGSKWPGQGYRFKFENGSQTIPLGRGAPLDDFSDAIAEFLRMRD